MRPVQAGGIIRTSLDNTWRTPESVLERVRHFFGGPIPFDPASAPDNPTKALRFCAGPPGTLFAEADPGSLFPSLPPTRWPGELVPGNGLEVAWDWDFFCNPPYGENIREWITKTGDEAARLSGRVGVTLWPASRWESEYLPPALARATAICLHRGRIAFVSSRDGVQCKGNPGASMLVGWNAKTDRFVDAFAPLGRCFALTALTRRRAS